MVMLVAKCSNCDSRYLTFAKDNRGFTVCHCKMCNYEELLDLVKKEEVGN